MMRAMGTRDVEAFFGTIKLFAVVCRIRRRAWRFRALAMHAMTAALLLTTLEEARAAAFSLPEGDFVARVYYERTSDLARLTEYDLHEYNNLSEKYVRVSANREIFEQLQRAGWRVSVDEEATGAMYPRFRPLVFLGGYRTVDELYASLAATVSNYPAITELTNYGQSYDKLI